MKDILKNLSIGIALLGILWSSLAIIILALFAFIIGNVAGGIVRILVILGICSLVAIVIDNNKEN